MNTQAQVQNEASPSSDGAGAAFVKQIKPWFIALLGLQGALLLLRWQMGDAHGALLMLAVVAVGALALTFEARGGIDEVYGGYFGLMALVSGLLDLNLSIEGLVWGEWRHLRYSSAKISLASFAKPLMYMVCAIAQLLSSFIAYLLYKDSYAEGDPDAAEPVFATADQARIYNAVLSHSERQASMEARQPGGFSPMKPFAGVAHKLP